MHKTLSELKIALPEIEEFVREVERRAEQKMLLTGKLEGAHYAAMKQLLEEIKGGSHADDK